MKSILLAICALTVLATSGCVVREHRGGGEFHEHAYRGGYHDSGYYHSAPDAGVNVRIHAD